MVSPVLLAVDVVDFALYKTFVCSNGRKEAVMRRLMNSIRPFQIFKTPLCYRVGRWRLSLADGVGEAVEKVVRLVG